MPGWRNGIRSRLKIDGHIKMTYGFESHPGHTSNKKSPHTKTANHAGTRVRCFRMQGLPRTVCPGWQSTMNGGQATVYFLKPVYLHGFKKYTVA